MLRTGKFCCNHMSCLAEGGDSNVPKPTLSAAAPINGTGDGELSTGNGITRRAFRKIMPFPHHSVPETRGIF
jgi:hypothetical protein